MTAAWVAQVPMRDEEQRQADREELLGELARARELLEREERDREGARDGRNPAASS